MDSTLSNFPGKVFQFRVRLGADLGILNEPVFVDRALRKSRVIFRPRAMGDSNYATSPRSHLRVQ